MGPILNNITSTPFYSNLNWGLKVTDDKIKKIFSTLLSLIIIFQISTKILQYFHLAPTLNSLSYHELDRPIFPCFCRETELDNLKSYINQKISTILVGKNGVGKRSLIYLLAESLKKENNRYKKIIKLNANDLFVDTSFRGTLERRIKDLVEYLARENCILFIENAEQLITSQDNISNILKLLEPFIKEKKIICILTTNPEGLNRLQQNQTNLVNDCQQMTIDPFDHDKNNFILSSLLPYLNKHFNVVISVDTCKEVLHLTQYFPGKPILKTALDLLTNACNNTKNKKKNPSTISPEDIRAEAQKITSIPILNPTPDQSKELKAMESYFNERLIGQKEVIEEICPIIRRSRLGLNEPLKPLGALMFVGPTGVGKTYLAELISENLKCNLIKFNMGEFQESSSINQLIGAPPGLLGYDQGSKLAQALNLNSFAVIVFDELEKAHPDVLKFLLNILDKGEAQTSQGEKINFRSAFIIATSNTGSNLQTINLEDESPETAYKKLSNNIEESLKQSFTPEFLNRFSAILHFNPSSREALLKIVDLEIKNLNQRLNSSHPISVVLDKDAKELILKQAEIDLKMGVRSLQRTIEKHILDRVITFMLDDKINNNKKTTITFAVKDSKFTTEIQAY